MNRETARALARVNRDFYARHAAEFAAKRSRPWPGWERVLEIFRASRRPGGGVAGGGHGPAILDAGCGHGRFAAFLDERLEGPLDYLGIDASAPLLEAARQRVRDAPGRRWRFVAADLLVPEPPPGVAAGRFDLVVALGLLHHLPGIELRRRLVGRLAESLAPGGVLALSFWQFGDRERFTRRTIAWEEHNRESPEPIDTAELEAGDVLLAWGETDTDGPPAAAARRYCHFAPPAEARELTGSLGLETVAELRADGRTGDLNLYRVLRREMI